MDLNLIKKAAANAADKLGNTLFMLDLLDRQYGVNKAYEINESDLEAMQRLHLKMLEICNKIEGPLTIDDLKDSL